MSDVGWTPPEGTERTIAVCAADARRLATGEEPLVRMVRVGDRWVPWHRSGAAATVVESSRHAHATNPGARFHQSSVEASLGGMDIMGGI